MAERQTPQLGPSLTAVLDPSKGDVWYDIPGQQKLQSPRAGTVETGTDGHLYVFVKASAEIAGASSPGTQVTITEPAFTAASGSGGFYAPISQTVPSGAFFWARKGAL